MDRKREARALQDQRILHLIETNKIRLPANEVLGNIYRRRGDLVAASAEYDRLHANGNTSPSVGLLQSVLNEMKVPARMPETDFAPAPFVKFDNLLDTQSNQFLLNYAVSRQAIFTQTELQKADEYGRQQRTNLVTYEVGAPGETMRALIRENLPRICDRLNLPTIDIKFIQLKIASYLNGDFFKAHQDNGENHPDRLISFVYYFNQEPKPYKGGDLLLYDSRFDPRAYVRSVFTRIIPRNNSMIFFPSEYFHEVSPVETDTQDFSSSRFTMAGHVG